MSIAPIDHIHVLTTTGSGSAQPPHSHAIMILSRSILTGEHHERNDLFPLSAEHEMIRQTARDLAQNEIAPSPPSFDRAAISLRDDQEDGCPGMMDRVPKSTVGLHDTLAYVLALRRSARLTQRMARSCRSTTRCFCTHPQIRHGNAKAKSCALSPPGKPWRLFADGQCPVLMPAPCAEPGSQRCDLT